MVGRCAELPWDLGGYQEYGQRISVVLISVDARDYAREKVVNRVVRVRL